MAAYTNGTHPQGTRPGLSRWERWQRNISHTYLTPEGAAAGFTVLKFTPSMAPAFFELVELIIARARLETRLAAVLEAQDAAATAALHDTLAAWRAWRRYTVQLARAVERQAQGRQATLPPIPPALHTLALALDDVPLDSEEDTLP